MIFTLSYNLKQIMFIQSYYKIYYIKTNNSAIDIFKKYIFVKVSNTQLYYVERADIQLIINNKIPK